MKETFSYRRYGSKFGVYLSNDEREVLTGVVDTEEQAKAAVIACNKQLQTLPRPAGHKPARIKVNTPTRQQLQAVLLALNPDRAADFRENLIFLNYSVHWLTAAVDEVVELFDGVLDASMKQHLKIITTQLERLLDGIYRSNIMGDATEYTDVAAAALALKDRFTKFICYGYSDEWRVREFDRVINNILPDDYIEQQRYKVATEIRELVENNGGQKVTETIKR